MHAPQHGLSLINRLIDHAVSFHSVRRPPGGNAIIIVFPEGERVFPWRESYWWSREWGGRYYSLMSALMALEAWAHRRIDAGEAFDKVLGDVLGPHGSPTAYLLVAVDLILSHWPKSREAAIPFLACPELLCLDKRRCIQDGLGTPDLFGLEAFQKEPLGAVSLDDLKKRPSRQASLDELLGRYIFGAVEERERLSTLLRHTETRLGLPDKESDLGDPRFMVVHALNAIDPVNWQETSITLADGREVNGHQYVPPPAENAHLSALQDAARDRQEEANMQAAISLALEDPSRSSQEFAAQAVMWGKTATTLPQEEDKDDNWLRQHAIVGAAMIAVRDGDPELRKTYEGWARGVFAHAFQTKEDPVHRVRWGLRYNPIAIAFAGFIYSLQDHSAAQDVRVLLEIAADENPAASHGFGAAAASLASVDERLPRSVLRCVFAASIRPISEWDLPEEEAAARRERSGQRVRAAVDAEVAWLAGEASEPDWPSFPSERVQIRWGLRTPGGRGRKHESSLPRRSHEHVDHQAASLWLKNARDIVDPVKRPWLRDVVRAYIDWTIAANGAGLDPGAEIADRPREWNNAFFGLLAQCLRGLALPRVEQLALAPIISLPDGPFFDMITEFLRSFDNVYFNTEDVEASIATGIRSALVNRLMASRGWKRTCSARSDSIEVHIGPAIGVLLFNDYYGFAPPPRCYLLSKAVDRLDPFLPILQNLAVEGASSLFVVLLTLNLLEVSPRPTQLHFMIAVVQAWLVHNADDNVFWVDQGGSACVRVARTDLASGTGII